MHPVVREIEKKNQRPAGDIPEFRPGDTVRVSLEIIEGKNRRVQDIEGVVIARRGGGMRESFTVRRVSFGVGMERTFPLHSPRIQGIKVVRRGKVRRSKLYYLRDLRGKKARITERRTAPSKAAAKQQAPAAPAVQESGSES